MIAIYYIGLRQLDTEAVVIERGGGAGGMSHIGYTRLVYVQCSQLNIAILKVASSTPASVSTTQHIHVWYVYDKSSSLNQKHSSLLVGHTLCKICSQPVTLYMICTSVIING